MKQQNVNNDIYVRIGQARMTVKMYKGEGLVGNQRDTEILHFSIFYVFVFFYGTSLSFMLLYM